MWKFVDMSQWVAEADARRMQPHARACASLSEWIGQSPRIAAGASRIGCPPAADRSDCRQTPGQFQL
jgi:hypothetical protein